MTVELAYSLMGDREKPLLVLSHALGSSSAMWDAQQTLANHYSLLLYDHRGHGASPAPPGPYTIGDLGADVLLMLDSIGAGSASFCGVSLGGMVGLWLAARHPERIERLVVLCALARLEPPSRYTERAATVRAHGIAPIASSVVARWFSTGFASKHPSTLEQYSDALAGMSAEGYAGCCEAIASCDLRDQVQRIAAPTLVIAGAEDPFVPPATAVMFAASFRDASAAVVPDSAHFVNVEKPDSVNRLVLEHLTDTGGPV